MRVFFGKISDKNEPKQLTEGYYRAAKGSTWFNGIEIGDYCYIVGGKKIQLWKAKNWNKRENDDVLEFDILINDLDINTIKFTSFKYFKLTVPLIVLTVRSTAKSSKAFFPIILEEGFSEEKLRKLETYKDETNYRQVWLHSSEVKVDSGLKDIQLYMNADGTWKIHKSDFILENAFDHFRDNTAHLGNGQSNKDKTLTLVKDKKNWDKPLAPYQISLLNIYDAFCCEYVQKSDDEVDVESEIKIKTEAKNLIFWGPPGTGKTYKLLQLQERFKTDKSEKKDQLVSWIQDLKWWEAMAAALIDLGNKPTRVEELLKHPFIETKAHLSESTQPDRTMWGTLQAHTVDVSKTVNVAKRSSPQIFNKSDSSLWYLEKGWEDQIPTVKNDVDKYKRGELESKDRFEMVTFHQSYSYEEFVEGIRPYKSDDGTAVIYDVKPGVFKRLCQRALENPESEYAIFIDEINRGNISKIFGELITLIEVDKRTKGKHPAKVTLPYSNTEFSVPSNLYIYGTMNSVDRSVALVDMALRRRFIFESLKPQKDQVRAEIEDVPLRSVYDKMNQKISVILGSEYQIGHSYLLHSEVKNLEDLRNAWFGCILPLIQEYLFDDWEKIQALVKDFVIHSGDLTDLRSLPLPKFSYGRYLDSDEVSDQKFKELLKKLA